MKLHIVKGPGVTRYAGSQTEARGHKAEMVQRGISKKEITIEPTVVETGKTALVAFINDLCEKADAVE